VFLRRQENPGVLQVMAVGREWILLLLFNIYSAPKTIWDDYPVLSCVLFHFVEILLCLLIHQRFSQRNNLPYMNLNQPD
jgi:hypothetical protein